ncbi:MAG: hypothetical protein ABSF87_15015 [Xanthobacteraceae bacterium]|jgi:hypothetical protein
MLPTWLDPATVKAIGAIGIPIVTFVLGFFASRWTMTKKERKDVEQKQFENSAELMTAQLNLYQEFTAALTKYNDKVGAVTFDDFYAIATTGEKYFYQQKIISDAILSGRVDNNARDNTLVPSIVQTVNKSLPAFYKTLQSIAQKKNFEYHGELRREDYESLYRVVEKYGKLD